MTQSNDSLLIVWLLVLQDVVIIDIPYSITRICNVSKRRKLATSLNGIRYETWNANQDHSWYDEVPEMSCTAELIRHGVAYRDSNTTMSRKHAVAAHAERRCMSKRRNSIAHSEVSCALFDVVFSSVLLKYHVDVNPTFRGAYLCSPICFRLHTWNLFKVRNILVSWLQDFVIQTESHRTNADTKSAISTRKSKTQNPFSSSHNSNRETTYNANAKTK